MKIFKLNLKEQIAKKEVLKKIICFVIVIIEIALFYSYNKYLFYK